MIDVTGLHSNVIQKVIIKDLPTYQRVVRWVYSDNKTHILKVDWGLIVDSTRVQWTITFASKESLTYFKLIFANLLDFVD